MMAQNGKPFLNPSNATKCHILMFPSRASGENTLPSTFPLAHHKGTFEDTLGNQKRGVDNFIKKMNLQQTDPEIVKSWLQFWEQCPKTNACARACS